MLRSVCFQEEAILHWMSSIETSPPVTHIFLFGVNCAHGASITCSIDLHFVSCLHHVVHAGLTECLPARHQHKAGSVPGRHHSPRL
jgi:hypothetical protein